MQQKKGATTTLAAQITVKLEMTAFNESNQLRSGWLYGICGQQLDEIEVKDAKCAGMIVKQLHLISNILQIIWISDGQILGFLCLILAAMLR